MNLDGSELCGGEDAGVSWNFHSKEATQRVFCSEIEHILEKIAEFDSDFQSGDFSCSLGFPKKMAVGVSGGSDSLSLLFLLKEWADSRKISLMCITVDHKLREDSQKEALFVQKICEEIGIKHVILDWIKDSYPSHGKLENLAREARYGLISEFCERESIGFVAIGHTWNDQLETFEMRKSLKSGAYGLACMSRARFISKNVRLIRPLMVFSREYLRDFLRAKRVAWKDDPMNQDEGFKRVAFRNAVNSLHKTEILNKTREIKFLGRRRSDIDRKAVDFLKEHIQAEQIKYGYMTFDSLAFADLGEDVQREVLKRAVWNIGGMKYAPNVDDVLIQIRLQKRVSSSIGRCLIKSAGNQIKIAREDRNLAQKILLERDGTFLFDNRFRLTLNGYDDFLREKLKISRNSGSEEISKCNFGDTSSKCFILSQVEFWRSREAVENLQQKSVEGRGLNECCESPKENELQKFENSHDLYEYSFPCICFGNKLLFVYGSDTDMAYNFNIECKFMNKVNLFDIFL